MEKILLSEADYNKFVEFCNKEPDPETITRLKNLFDRVDPWDATLGDGLDEWRWYDEDK